MTHELALGHTHDGEARPRFRPPQEKAAAGGLFTTAGDYLRFLVQSLGARHRHVRASGADRRRPQLGGRLGHRRRPGDGRAVWQWGNDPGYKNFVIGRPADGAGVVVFTNGDRGASVYAEVVRCSVPRRPSIARDRSPAALDDGDRAAPRRPHAPPRRSGRAAAAEDRRLEAATKARSSASSADAAWTASASSASPSRSLGKRSARPSARPSRASAWHTPPKVRPRSPRSRCYPAGVVRGWRHR